MKIFSFQKRATAQLKKAKQFSLFEFVLFFIQMFFNWNFSSSSSPLTRREHRFQPEISVFHWNYKVKTFPYFECKKKRRIKEKSYTNFITIPIIYVFSALSASNCFFFCLLWSFQSVSFRKIETHLLRFKKEKLCSHREKERNCTAKKNWLSLHHRTPVKICSIRFHIVCFFFSSQCLDWESSTVNHRLQLTGVRNTSYLLQLISLSLLTHKSKMNHYRTSWKSQWIPVWFVCNHTFCFMFKLYTKFAYFSTWNRNYPKMKSSKSIVLNDIFCLISMWYEIFYQKWNWKTKWLEKFAFQSK